MVSVGLFLFCVQIPTIFFQTQPTGSAFVSMAVPLIVVPCITFLIIYSTTSLYTECSMMIWEMSGRYLQKAGNVDNIRPGESE